MDLDEIELKATRIMNGAARSKFNINDIVIFKEDHKWKGCIGRITNIKYIPSIYSNEIITNIEVTVNIPDKEAKVIYTSITDIEKVSETI